VAEGEALLRIGRVACTCDGRPVDFHERRVNTRHHAYLNLLGKNA